MQEWLQLGLGGAGFLALSIVIEKLISFIRDDRKATVQTMDKLADAITSLKESSEKTIDAMEKVTVSMKDHHDFVKMYMSFQSGTAGGGDDNDNP